MNRDNPQLSSDKNGIIYKIVCKTNNKIYIGQTICTLKKRWKEHKYNAKLYLQNKANGTLDSIPCIRSSKLYRAMAKYGIESFDITVIDNVSRDEINSKEVHHIATENSISPHGYNLTSGGNSYAHNQVTKDKISHTKQQNADKYRNELLVGFPPRCSLTSRNNRKCVRLVNHPNCPKANKFFYIDKYDSIEICKQCLINYVQEIEILGKRYEHYTHIDRPKQPNACMTGFIKTKAGYKVRNVFGLPGYVKTKCFESSKISDDNKKTISNRLL